MTTRPTPRLLFSAALSLLVLLPGYAAETNAPAASDVPDALEQANSGSPTNTIGEVGPPRRIAATQRIPLAPEVAQVVDLAQSGLGEAVLLEYIKNSTNAYDLNVDQIVYLNDLGLSDTILAAMIRRGNQIREQQAAMASAPPTEPDAQAPAPPPQIPDAPMAPAAPTISTAAFPPPAEPVPVESAPPTVEVVEAPPPAVSYNYFYDALSPYGNWVEMPEYGWCWRPTCSLVDVSWRPYCHRGRWINSDCGWYWYSDYSWGWIPFHYGRWCHAPGAGWVWTPGSAWSPAWVAWRHDNAYCGWAPLPPEAHWSAGIGLTFHGSRAGVGFGFGLGADSFTFVSYHHMTDPAPYRHALPRHEVAQIYGRTTVINNVTISNSRITNPGIAPERITAVTRKEVPKVALHDAAGGPSIPRRAERLDREGATLAVYRPAPPHDLLATPSRHIETPQPALRRLSEPSPQPTVAGTVNRAPSSSVIARPLGSQPSLSQRNLGQSPSQSVPASRIGTEASARTMANPAANGTASIQQRSTYPQPAQTVPGRPQGTQGQVTRTYPYNTQPQVTRIEPRKSDPPTPQYSTPPKYTYSTPSTSATAGRPAASTPQPYVQSQPRWTAPPAAAYSQPARSAPSYSAPARVAAPSAPAPSAAPARTYSAPSPAASSARNGRNNP